MGLGQSSRRQSKAARIAEVMIVLSIVSGGAYFGATKYQESQESKNLISKTLERAADATSGMAKGAVQANRTMGRMILEPAAYEKERQENEFKALNLKLSENPDDIYSLAKRLSIFEIRGETEHAQADLERLVALKAPFLGAPHYNDRAYYQAKSEGDFEGALPRAEYAVKSSPDTPAYWETLAYIYVGLGQYDKAVTLYDKTLSVIPDRESALWGRAAALKGLGKLEEAKRGFTRVRLLDPDFCLHWPTDPDLGSHKEE